MAGSGHITARVLAFMQDHEGEFMLGSEIWRGSGVASRSTVENIIRKEITRGTVTRTSGKPAKFAWLQRHEIPAALRARDSLVRRTLEYLMELQDPGSLDILPAQIRMEMACRDLVRALDKASAGGREGADIHE